MYRNIVIPVNVFTQTDVDKEIYHAQFFANVSSGHVHLLGVIPEGERIIERGYFSDVEKFEHNLHSRASVRLLELASQFVLPEGFIHTHVHSGAISEGVQKLAARRLADVIIFDSRRHDLQKSAMFGGINVPMFVI